MKRRTTIAIVDDEESVVRALTRFLHSAGLEARGFSSAAAFLGSLVNGAVHAEPDCALVDVQMPVTDGLALHQELLRRGSRLPILFMTAHDTDEVRELALRQGAKAYLTKPLAEQALLAAITASTAPALTGLEHRSEALGTVPPPTGATDRESARFHPPQPTNPLTL